MASTMDSAEQQYFSKMILGFFFQIFMALVSQKGRLSFY
jgi:hypothetical protein